MVSDFSVEELFDVYAITEYLLMRTFRRSMGESSQSIFLERLSYGIKVVLLDRGVFHEILEKRKLLTSIDVVNYGRLLMRPEFREEINSAIL